MLIAEMRKVRIGNVVVGGEVELEDDDEENVNNMFQVFRYKMAEEMRNDVMENIHVCYNFNLIIVYLLPVNNKSARSPHYLMPNLLLILV